jgi:hypothetical protein
VRKLKMIPTIVTPVKHHCVAIRSSAILLLCFFISSQLPAQQKTYCNPINIDYGYTPIPNFSEWGRHRATADPVIVLYKNDYYLFSTNQWGYWWSSDMLNWNFVSKKFLRPWNTGTYDELCARQLVLLAILCLFLVPPTTASSLYG